MKTDEDHSIKLAGCQIYVEMYVIPTEYLDFIESFQLTYTHLLWSLFTNPKLIHFYGGIGQFHFVMQFFWKKTIK